MTGETIRLPIIPMAIVTPEEVPADLGFAVIDMAPHNGYIPAIEIPTITKNIIFI